MKHRIHMRIFIPVLIVIFLLPAATWCVFSATSTWYIRHMTQKSVTEFANEIEKEVEQIYGSQSQTDFENGEGERDASKQLLSWVKTRVRNGTPEADLIVLNSKMKQIYPGGSFEESAEGKLYVRFKEMLETGTLAKGTTARLQLGDKQYLADLLEVDSERNIRAKYYIVYAEIPDMNLLLSYTGKLMAAITLVFLLLSGLAVWWVARSIAKPLEELCGQTDLIGNGTYAPVCGQYSIWELRRLQESFNAMAERLKASEEQNMRFFQNVSHDLRTPLVSITGYAQGIQCGVMKDTKKSAEIILTESLRMTNLVDSILMISKLDNHEWKLRRVKILLAEFLEEQVEILQGISDGKQLCVSENDFALSAEADPDLLIRIFQNVVSNCIQYAESKVEVKLAKSGNWAEVRVEDDGPGIGEEELEHIFERFYRGEHGKFGIGLSVVWSGLKYMGGKVGIENKTAPDHGVVYRLSLPLADE